MIDLYTIGFNRPDLLREQKRLLDKYLRDEYRLTVVDNTPLDRCGPMLKAAKECGINYMRPQTENHLHSEALDFAALHVTQTGSLFYGFLDHDIFPTKETTLIDKIEQRGFLGIGQTHRPTGHQYLWPGFCFFSREWVADRRLNFDGIRGEERKDDGDCGSMNWPLFEGEEIPDIHFGYGIIREPDACGLQSYGYEMIGDWIHFSNSSDWMKVPDPAQRRELLKKILWEL